MTVRPFARTCAGIVSRVAGASRGPDVMAPFVEYCRIRLADDPHLWASALLDELRELGYAGSYPSLTGAIRARGLRPHCEPCQASAGRDAAIIAHPPGEETQFDWVELPGPPPGWGCGAHAHLLAGALSSSGRWRGVLAEAEDFAHLAEALDQVARKLGGLIRWWRFDRMATVCHPGSGQLTATFAGLAKYYGVGVDICPSRHGNRKGVVEKASHSAAQRWWRILPDDATWATVQQGVDALAGGWTNGAGCAAGSGWPSASWPPPSRCGRCPRCRSRPGSPRPAP
jgi:hypothetical protein